MVGRGDARNSFFGGMKSRTLVMLNIDTKRDIVLLCSALTPIITQPEGEDPMDLEGASTELSKLLDEVGRVFSCHRIPIPHFIE